MSLLILFIVLAFFSMLLTRLAKEHLVAIAFFVDTFSRICDFVLLRNVERDSPRWRPRNLGGHSISSIIPFMLLVPFLVVHNGDSFLWFGKVFVVELIILASTQWLPRHKAFHPLNIQIVIIGAMATLSFVAPDSPWSFGGPVQGSAGIQDPQMILVAVLIVLLIGRIGGGVASRYGIGSKRLRLREELELGERLKNVDLFVSPKRPEEGSYDLVSSLWAVPLREPITLVYLPSLLMLVVRDRTWMLFVAIVVLWLWWNFLAMAILNKRLHTVLNIIRRLLFRSWMYWISILLIACAVCRIFDFKYINIMLEGDRWLILQFFGTAYLTLWNFQYWTNRFINEALLDLFGDGATKPSEIGFYSYETHPEVIDAAVDPKFRKLQLHTGARFVAVGIKPTDLEDSAAIDGEPQLDDFDDRGNLRPISKIERIERWALGFYNRVSSDEKERFHFYERIPLLITLVSRSNQNEGIRDAVQRQLVGSQGECQSNNRCSLESGESVETRTKEILRSSIDAVTEKNRESAKALRNLIRMVNICVGALNLLPLALLFGVLVVSGYAAKDAMIVAQKDADGTFDLRQAIFDTGASETPRKQAVLVAASGGGTRAAIHAASVMDGIHLAGASDDIVLLSGISGGSVGLAYYAAHFHQLRTEDKFETWSALDRSDSRWKHFHEAMRANYIRDVLLGAANEWRVLSGRVTIGDLLAESLDAHFYSELDSGDANAGENDLQMKRMGLTEFGLILNTTLTGSYPFEVSGDSKSPVEMRKFANLASAYHTGERLVFTNLKDPSDSAPPQTIGKNAVRLNTQFPARGLSESPHDVLQYVVVRDPDVQLAFAAAASANFPPVFPNAAVDLYSKKDGAAAADERHWITDGGVMDNRGILSLLFALRHALKEQKSIRTFSPEKIPEIHVLVAEASAVAVDYTHDRGSNALINAKAKVANQLMIELLDQIQDAYRELQTKPAEGSKLKRVQVHYLSLPSALRMRGGVGTHWMMPASLELRDPRPLDQGLAHGQTLEGEEVARIMWELHRPDRRTDSKARIQDVWTWIENDPWIDYDARWEKAMSALQK